MVGTILFFILILVEVGFLVFSVISKTNLAREKSLVRMAIFGVFFILLWTPVIDWGIGWYMLGLILGMQAIIGIIFLLRKKGNKPTKNSRLIFGFIGRIFLIVITFFPLFLFPQYEQIEPTGDFTVATKSFTLTDKLRKEQFTEEANDHRQVTIQFWYPDVKSTKEKFPLVIFSHGAFGVRSSNFSTYQELASNGYVVCSIDHTYHAFVAMQEDGKAVVTNMDFMNNAMKASNGELSDREIYDLEQEWMKIRTKDMEFVINYIKDEIESAQKDKLYNLIDLERIGTFGHSLGGATAAQIGRELDDVDAVIVIDGTMLGEIIGFEAGKNIVTDVPFPKPIMNIYSEVHYNEEFTNADYANRVAHENALDSYIVVVADSDHMNFTDLPLVSPFLSNLLGTGTVDARKCIETTNKVVLTFFDHFLKEKQGEIPKVQKF